MRGCISVVLLCLSASVRAEYSFNKHEFYSGPPNYIKIPQEHLEMLFKALDKNGNGQIEKADLAQVFANPHAAGDADKFMVEADSDDPDKTVNQHEFEDFMSDISAVWAVAECKASKKAKRLIQACYVDEFISYVHAMMPFDEVIALFKVFDVEVNGEINIADMEKIITMNSQDSVTNRNDLIHTLLNEWAHGGTRAPFVEFKTYVRQADIYSSMKLCQHQIPCYQAALLKFTLFHLTEQDIYFLFRKLDKNNDGVLDEEDLELYTTNPESFYRVVDFDNNLNKVIFEEFRLYLRRILIRDLLSEICGNILNSDQQLTCYADRLFGLQRYAYKYAKIFIAHSDTLYAFEELDSDNNGKIDNNDLLKLEKDEATRQKIITELDTSNKGQSVDLEEMAYSISYPSTTYALSGCLFLPKSKQSECCAKALVEFVGQMLPSHIVIKFYQSYDKEGRHKITSEEVGKVIPPGEYHDQDVANFLGEIGLGDDEVTQFEFSSYIRHPDLKERFKKYATLTTIDDNMLKEMQDILYDYIQKSLTEYDIEVTFEHFDVNKDYEIEIEDLTALGKPEDQSKKFLAAMDSDDEGTNVDFKEFRAYLLKSECKAKLEEGCSLVLPTQKEEVECYKDNIWTIATT